MNNEVNELFEKGNYQEAIRIFTDNSTGDSDDLRTLIQISESYYRINKFDYADVFCNKALAIDPNNASAMMVKAKILIAQHEDDEKALDFAQKAYDLNPGHPDFQVTLGNAYIMVNNYYDGIRLLEGALAHSNDKELILNNLAVAYGSTKQYSKYLESMKALFIFHPTYPRLIRYIGSFILVPPKRIIFSFLFIICLLGYFLLAIKWLLLFPICILTILILVEFDNFRIKRYKTRDIIYVVVFIVIELYCIFHFFI
jgi:tetratricopeptide (TPR) repeat protein